jgi:SAM-dependent methyltransferase
MSDPSRSWRQSEYQSAGAGSVVEPSAVMRAQRPAGAAPCVAAVAESLPFADGSFDAAMAVSTVHHRRDPVAGLREMGRVARRVVVLTFDASETVLRHRFWLTRDYLPEFAGLILSPRRRASPTPPHRRILICDPQR